MGQVVRQVERQIVSIQVMKQVERQVVRQIHSGHETG